MEIVTKRPSKEKQRNAGSERLPQPQLLDSPLPTPRRSCASTDAPSSLRCSAGVASPLRTQVPFSWESSPGVPKSGRDARTAREETMMMPPPKPPPGRWPPHPQCPASRTNWCYTSEGSSDDCDASSFSDAIDRASSSPERIGSFDRVTSKRFEDIFLGRAESFAAKDRSCGHALAAANGADIAIASSRHSKHWRRRGGSTRHDDNDGERPKNRQSSDPVQVVPRVDIAARVEQMSPRACGLMVFFPWSSKPAISGFRSPSTRHAAPRSGATDHSLSHSRGNTTLRDALQVDNKTDDIDVQDSPQQPRREKRSREEWQGGRGWGVSSQLDTSKRYCTDARKALSKLSIGLGADGGSPRLGRDRRSGKQGATMAAKLTMLKTNRN